MTGHLLAQLDQDLAAIVAGVRPSLVQLTSDGHSLGAGTIWHSDGLIVTNAHVVSGGAGGMGRWRRQQPEAPTVTLWDGRTYTARLLAMDPQLDLAALTIDASNLPTIPVGNSRQLRAGQWVLALGHPWGVLGATAFGAIIDVGMPVEPNRYPGELVQIGIQLRPGHSGGPLVDEHGRIVGINTMIAGPQVGLAVPVHVAGQFLRDKINNIRATTPA